MNSENVDLGIDDNFGQLSRDVSNCLVNVNIGTSTKMSLLKMMIIKCDENVSTHKRLRGSLENGDVNEADRLLQVLEEQNMINLSDL